MGKILNRWVSQDVIINERKSEKMENILSFKDPPKNKQTNTG